MRKTFISTFLNILLLVTINACPRDKEERKPEMKDFGLLMQERKSTIGC